MFKILTKGAKNWVGYARFKNWLSLEERIPRSPSPNHPLVEGLFLVLDFTHTTIFTQYLASYDNAKSILEC